MRRQAGLLSEVEGVQGDIRESPWLLSSEPQEHPFDVRPWLLRLNSGDQVQK